MNPATQKKVVLLVQLGSPDAPTPQAIRRYLKEFLSDPRVMDISPLARTMILNLFILPRRPAKVAPKYQGIWQAEGSPLLVESQGVKALLKAQLGENYQVELAMRYGNPGMPEVLARLERQAPSEIVMLPLFPQYASATTGSAVERFFELIGTWQVIPQVRVINQFFADPGFIAAWVAQGQPLWAKGYDHAFFSFHGLPESQIRKADASGQCLSNHCCQSMGSHNQGCYRAQCFETARKIAAGLGMGQEQFSIGFQSRLGKAKWIEPYTSEALLGLLEQGKKRVLVFSPSFVADCLETLEEIGQEEREAFLGHGGEELTMVPSLNQVPTWIQALANLVR